MKNQRVRQNAIKKGNTRLAKSLRKISNRSISETRNQSMKSPIDISVDIKLRRKYFDQVRKKNRIVARRIKDSKSYYGHERLSRDWKIAQKRKRFVAPSVPERRVDEARAAAQRALKKRQIHRRRVKESIFPKKKKISTTEKNSMGKKKVKIISAGRKSPKVTNMTRKLMKVERKKKKPVRVLTSSIDEQEQTRKRLKRPRSPSREYLGGTYVEYFCSRRMKIPFQEDSNLNDKNKKLANIYAYYRGGEVKVTLRDSVTAQVYTFQDVLGEKARKYIEAADFKTPDAVLQLQNSHSNIVQHAVRSRALRLLKNVSDSVRVIEFNRQTNQFTSDDKFREKLRGKLQLKRNDTVDSLSIQEVSKRYARPENRLYKSHFRGTTGKCLDINIFPDLNVNEEMLHKLRSRFMKMYAYQGGKREHLEEFITKLDLNASGNIYAGTFERELRRLLPISRKDCNLLVIICNVNLNGEIDINDVKRFLLASAFRVVKSFNDRPISIIQQKACTLMPSNCRCEIRGMLYFDDCNGIHLMFDAVEVDTGKVHTVALNVNGLARKEMFGTLQRKSLLKQIASRLRLKIENHHTDENRLCIGPAQKRKIGPREAAIRKIQKWGVKHVAKRILCARVIQKEARTFLLHLRKIRMEQEKALFSAVKIQSYIRGFLIRKNFQLEEMRRRQSIMFLQRPDIQKKLKRFESMINTHWSKTLSQRYKDDNLNGSRKQWLEDKDLINFNEYVWSQIAIASELNVQKSEIATAQASFRKKISSTWLWHIEKKTVTRADVAQYNHWVQLQMEQILHSRYRSAEIIQRKKEAIMYKMKAITRERNVSNRQAKRKARTEAIKIAARASQAASLAAVKASATCNDMIGEAIRVKKKAALVRERRRVKKAIKEAKKNAIKAAQLAVKAAFMACKVCRDSVTEANIERKRLADAAAEERRRLHARQVRFELEGETRSIVVQKMVRGVQGRKRARDRRLYVAVRTIQCVVRIKQAYKRYICSRRNFYAAATIQKNVRRMVYISFVITMRINYDRASRLIQRMERGRQGRAAAQQRRTEIKATIMVQSCARMLVCTAKIRKKLQRIRRRRRRLEAAILMQRNYRLHMIAAIPASITMQRVIRGGRVRCVIVPRLLAKNRGAKAAQKIFRGFKARHLVSLMRRYRHASTCIQKYERRRQCLMLYGKIKAIIVIQALARGYFVREIYYRKRKEAAHSIYAFLRAIQLQRRCSARLIQRVGRGKIGRDYAFFRKAVVKCQIVQCCWRQKVARQALRTRQRFVAAEKISKIARGRIARKALMIEIYNQAAMKIQSSFRMFLGRARFRDIYKAVRSQRGHLRGGPAFPHMLNSETQDATIGMRVVLADCDDIHATSIARFMEIFHISDREKARAAREAYGEWGGAMAVIDSLVDEDDETVRLRSFFELNTGLPHMNPAGGCGSWWPTSLVFLSK
eukprot:g1563.t1